MSPFSANNILDFIKPLWSELESLELLKVVEACDHICYRVSTYERYEECKKMLLSCSDLLTETLVNGRPIATYKLREPVCISDSLQIPLIELPAPKAGQSYSEGFEHIEIVVKGDLKVFIQSRLDLDFDSSNMSATTNRDASLELNSGIVKFHEKSLEEVINQEQASNKAKRANQVIVFDFDDTIAKTSEAFLKAAQRLLQQHLHQDISWKDMLDRKATTFPDFLSNFGITDKNLFPTLIEAFFQHWQSVKDNAEVKTGIDTLISTLFHEGVRLIVWTARDEATTEQFLKERELYRFFHSVHGFDGKGISKPEPSKSLLSAIGGREAILVGDSQTDSDAANKLDASFAQAAWYESHSLKNEPEVILTNPLEAIETMLNLFDR